MPLESPSARPLRRLASGIAVLLAALLCVSLLASPAAAAPATTIGIQQVGGDTHPSGDDFDYEVAFQCSNVDDPPDPCEGVVLRIPLGDAADFAVDVPGLSPDQWYVDEATGELVIVLGEVAAGASTTVPFTITPPNYTTPDGTSWTLTPVADSSNATPSTGTLPDPYSSSVTSTATADLNHTVSKTLQGSVFREPGDEITWTVTVACSQRSSGSLFASSIEVVDTLPAGLTYVSSEPAGTASGNTVTWNLPGNGGELPSSCDEAGSNGTVSFEVTAIVDEDFVPESGAEELVNGVDSTAIPVGETTGTTQSDDSGVTVTDDPPTSAGTLGKDSFGQLNDSGDDANSDESHTTFPGAWNGYYDQQPGNVLRNYRPNEDTDYNQSGYKLRYRNADQALGFQVELQEPMPCFDDADGSGVIHSSREPGDLCAADDLAFHPTTVSIWAHNPANYGLPAISSDYVPTATLASTGAVVDLVRTEAGNSWVNYQVPAANIGDIAELNFGRDPGMASDDMRWGIFGYADDENVNGTIVRNTGTVTSYYGDATTPTGDPHSESADLRIVDGPLIGIQKELSPSQVDPGGTVGMELTGFLDTLAAVDTDLVITDLLPTGFTWADPVAPFPTTIEVTYVTEDNPAGVIVEREVELAVEVIDKYQGTGRQLLRFTLDHDELTDFGAVQTTVPVALDLVAPTQPGNYTNQAQVFYDDEDLSTTCNQVPNYEQLASDPLDLDGNPNTARYCQGQDDVVIEAPSGTAEFALEKTVQGDTDPAPRTPPSVATVTEEGGSVTFGLNWTNVGAASLDSAVLYDIFPHVGDTGVSGTQADAPRGSQFDATFEGVVTPLPAGVTVQYTTSDNPCRPEVYPGQGECDDAWSATEPADPSTVTGIRVSSERTYATGEGFSVALTMTTPPIELGEVAWNSVAGVANNTASGTALLPSEPPKVGFTAYDPNLPPVLEKIADVQTAAAGDEITYTIRVSNPAGWVQEGVELSDELPEGLSYVSATGAPTVAGQTLTWDAFDLEPWEVREFTVVGSVDAGALGTLANIARVPGAIIPDPCEDDPDEACAPVVIEGADLTLSKVVSGAAAEFAPQTFDLVVDCVVDGSSVGGFPRTVSVAGNASSDAIEVPYESTCTVTEPDSGGATSVEIDPAGGVEILPDGPAEFTVTVDNEYAAGALVVEKTLSGVGAPAFAAGPFEFAVSCLFNDASVLEETVTLERSEDEDTLTSQVFAPLPVGAACTVTETDAGGADATADPVTVEITDDVTDPVVAAVENEFSAGVLEVGKQVVGDDADAAADIDFTVRVVCEFGDAREVLLDEEITLRGGDVVQLVDESDELLALPVGTACYVEETDDGGADGVEIEHGTYETAAVVEAGQPDEAQVLSLLVVNEFTADAPPHDGTDDGKGNGGLLPDTGSPVSIPLLLLALVLVFAGTGFVLRTRR